MKPMSGTAIGNCKDSSDNLRRFCLEICTHGITDNKIEKLKKVVPIRARIVCCNFYIKIEFPEVGEMQIPILNGFLSAFQESPISDLRSHRIDGIAHFDSRKIR